MAIEAPPQNGQARDRGCASLAAASSCPATPPHHAQHAWWGPRSGRAELSQEPRGFTLIELVAVMAVIAIVSAMAIPSMLAARDRIRLGQAAREVEREIQSAKARAVAKSRPMRVRFNCPTDGEYRAVELIGTAAAPVAADSAANRCSGTAYPYPPPDLNPNTRPNLDGPVRMLDSTVSFSVSQTIEFRPDGTAYRDPGGGGVFELIPTTGINIRVARDGLTRTITVNGLGKVQLQ